MRTCGLSRDTQTCELCATRDGDLTRHADLVIVAVKGNNNKPETKRNKLFTAIGNSHYFQSLTTFNLSGGFH